MRAERDGHRQCQQQRIGSDYRPHRAQERPLKAYQAEQDKANKPILALLQTNEDLLADNNAQLSRLLDLYRSGTFDKDMLTDRKMRLETTIAKLERERGELQARLGHGPSDDEIDELVSFARDLADGIDAADKDFAKRRKIIEVLDVRVRAGAVQ